MPSPPKDRSPRLHKDVALEVARVAGVPPEEHDAFCELLQGTVETVWELDRRALSSKPGQALLDAAQAARDLYKAFGELNKQDRRWVEGLPAKDPRYGGELRELPLILWRIGHLFSTAVGKSLPGVTVQAASPKKPDSRQRTVKYPTFENFLTDLHVDVAETGGQLTFTRESRTGTLLAALDILRRHLPEGVVPKDDDLPLGIIKKVRSKNFRNFYAEHADLEIFPPNSPRRRRTK